MSLAQKLFQAFCLALLVAAVTGSAGLWAAESRLDELLEASRRQQLELDRYREEVARIESEFGPFDPALIEVLEGLALTLQQGGDFEEMLSVRNRRLQLARSNLGLNDARVLPLLEGVIEAQLLMNDWQAVADSLEMERSIRVASSSAREGTQEELLGSLERQMQWDRAMVIVGDPSDRSRRLLNLRETSETALEIAEQICADDPIALAYWRYQHAHAIYSVVAAMNSADVLGVDTVQLLVREDGPLKLSRNAGRFGQVFNLSPQQRYVPVLRQGELLGEAYVREGRSLINDSREEFEAAGMIEQQAIATILAGDFQLLSGRGSGLKDYREAIELLTEAGFDPARIQRFFAEPRPLPLPSFPADFNELEALSGAAADQPGSELALVAWERSMGGMPRPALGPYFGRLDLPLSYARVEFDLGTQGQTSGVNVLHTEPDEGRTRRTARQGVRLLHFRPPVIENRIQRRRNLQLDYYFIPKSD